MSRNFVFLLTALLTFNVYASDEVLSLHRLSEPIVFDGIVNDKAWDYIKPLPVIMNVPEFRGDMTEVTEIRVAYDAEYVYVSGINLDKEADKIMANTKKRDALSPSTEWFGIIIDSFNDKENACAFFTTPTGLRMDAQVVNDGLGRNPINLSWNNFWDVKTTRDSKGWYVEMRIPFTSLPFEPEGNRVTMGMTAWRYIARKNELHVYPEIPPDFGEWSTWRPSLMQEFAMSHVDASKPFYVIPYALGGFQKSSELNENETKYFTENRVKKEIGLDVKYGINNNWTLDLSVNTDFAQVEVDDQQVNLTRFSLFFPEKRLFFQERSGVFNFNLDRTDQLFYSRRIGLDEDNNQQRILGGARVVGRAGLWDIGFLNMHTGGNDNQLSENFSVLRAKTQVFNPLLDAGFVITNRMNFDGSFNTAYGLDATINLRDQTYLNIRWAQTIDSEADYSLFSLDPSIFKLWLSRRISRGLGYGFSYTVAGKDFNPDMGFQQRENYQRFGNRLQYTFAPENSKIFRHGFNSGGIAFWNKENGEIESMSWRVGWDVSWKNTWNFQVSFRPRIENLFEPFDLSDDVIIPIGKYHFNAVELSFGTPSTFPVYTVMQISRGDFYDGDIFSISAAPAWAASSSLELNLNYEYNLAQFDIRNETFKVHLLGMKALYMFNTEL